MDPKIIVKIIREFENAMLQQFAAAKDNNCECYPEFSRYDPASYNMVLYFSLVCTSKKDGKPTKVFALDDANKAHIMQVLLLRALNKHKYMIANEILNEARREAKKIIEKEITKCEDAIKEWQKM